MDQALQSESDDVVLTARRFVESLTKYGAHKDADLALELALRLRNARKFEELLSFTEQCITAKITRPGLLRLNGHANIELGRLGEALSVLTALKDSLEGSLKDSKEDDEQEYSQAIGLLGRAYKQIFLNNETNPDRVAPRSALQLALRFYYEGFTRTAGKPDFVWHGVNVAALARRAAWDGLPPLVPVDWKDVARQVELEIIERERRGPRSAWDCATAGEACLALDEPARAIEWFTKYAEASEPGVNALHSILRQMKELWKIKPDHTRVGKIFAMLQARLVCVEEGELTIDGSAIAASPAAGVQDKGVLERVFGSGSIVSYDSFMRGLSRGRCIARIGPSDKAGMGTGFLVNGGDFNRSWKGERLLLTNAHVVSDDRRVQAQEGAIPPSKACATFTYLPGRPVHRVAKLLWTSSHDDLDATLLRLDPEPPPELEGCEIALALPPRPQKATQKPLVYILGHPGGGELSISLHNNEIIDHDGPEPGREPPPQRVRIRYLTPTTGGSSGSPVFFGDEWQVVGLHHASNESWKPLVGDGPTYPGNEAIWIQSIVGRTRSLHRFL